MSVELLVIAVAIDTPSHHIERQKSHSSRQDVKRLLLAFVPDRQEA